MKLVNAHLQQLRGEDKLKIAQLMADLESKNSVRAWQGEVGVGGGGGEVRTSQINVPAKHLLD